MRIFLVRHGDTEYNAKAIFRGTLDVPLSDTGLEQARLTGTELSHTKISLTLSSPLSRALDTAKMIAEKQASSPVLRIDEDLTDIHFGDWQGRSREEVAATYPDLFSIWMNEPHHARFPRGESIHDAFLRASSGLKRYVADDANEIIAVVSHRVIIKLLVLFALGMSESEFWRIHVDTCGISVIDYDHIRDEFVLVRHNSISHLSSLFGKISSHDF
jgi:probable phosphoglycerate mutase